MLEIVTHNTRSFINENYNEIKTLLKKECRKLKNLNFDEDVFHDTLIKCMIKNETLNLSNEKFISYLIVSFKTNIKRNKQYFINSKRYDGEIEDFNACNNMKSFDKNNIDINKILEDVEKNFNEDVKNKFYDWCINQMTINEINNKYNCNNTRYLIDKVKKYIQKNYNIKDFIN